MTVTGFRLNTITLHKGRTRKPLPLDHLGENSATAAGLLQAQAEAVRGVVFAQHATYSSIEEDPDDRARLKPGTPVMRVDDVRRAGERVEVLVSYGRIGDYQFLLDADGQAADEPLDRLAPGRRYWNVFYGSKVGTQCVIASSVVSRTHTGEALLYRLSVEAARAARRSADEGDWFRWRPGILVDEQRVREVIESGSVDGVRLKRRAYNAAGQLETRPIVLTQNGIREADQPKVVEMVIGWLERLAGKRVANMPGAVAALVELVEVPNEVHVGAMGFTDGALSVSENGKTQSVTPSNLHRILTYPLPNETTPPVQDVHAAASKRIEMLRTLIDGSLDLG